jgi:hypothetical protein
MGGRLVSGNSDIRNITTCGDQVPTAPTRFTLQPFLQTGPSCVCEFVRTGMPHPASLKRAAGKTDSLRRTPADVVAGLDNPRIDVRVDENETQ